MKRGNISFSKWIALTDEIQKSYYIPKKPTTKELHFMNISIKKGNLTKIERDKYIEQATERRWEEYYKLKPLSDRIKWANRQKHKIISNKKLQENMRQRLLDEWDQGNYAIRIKIAHKFSGNVSISNYDGSYYISAMRAIGIFSGDEINRVESIIREIEHKIRLGELPDDAMKQFLDDLPDLHIYYKGIKNPGKRGYNMPDTDDDEKAEYLEATIEEWKEKLAEIEDNDWYK